jgi:peptidylprolyl isomerase
VRRSLSLPLILLAVAALFVGACGSDDDEADGDSTTTAGGDVPAGAEIVSVSDDLSTAPEIELEPTDEAPAELVVEDIVVGDGTEAVAGSTVEVQYNGVLPNDEEFDSSWETGQPLEFALGSGMVIPGWDEGVAGMLVGGRRALVIPPNLAYGPSGSPPVIPANATLVFVVDLVGVVEPPPAGATITSVSDDLSAKPVIELEGTDAAPTELVVEDIVVGDGAEAVDGSTVEVQYVGVLTDGEEFDASWDGEPFSFTLGAGRVIPGWEEGVAGMKVGGRRALIIPSALAYGPTGSGPIPADATLVFVVDLLAVT